MQRQRCPDSKTKIRGVAYSWERLGDGEKEAILASIRGASAPPPPRVVEISWQDRCNIDCFFCSTSEIRAGNFELSRERLEALFDEMQALGVRACGSWAEASRSFARMPPS